MIIHTLEIWRSLVPWHFLEEDIEWFSQYGNDWERAWHECRRGDWLLSLCMRLNIDIRWVAMAACWCAAQVLRCVHGPTGARELHDAIWTTVRWCRGEVALEKVREARLAARKISASFMYTDYAAGSAQLAIDSACAVDPTDAHFSIDNTANYVASAIAASARVGGVDETSIDIMRRASFSDSADYVRKVIPWPMVEECLLKEVA